MGWRSGTVGRWWALGISVQRWLLRVKPMKIRGRDHVWGRLSAPERGGAIRAGPWFVGRLAGRGGGTVGCWRAAWPYRCKGCLVPVGAVGAKAPTHMKEIALSGGFRVFQPYFFGECTNCTKHQPPFPTCATSVKITLTTFGRAFFPPIGYTYRNRWCRLV